MIGGIEFSQARINFGGIAPTEDVDNGYTLRQPDGVRVAARGIVNYLNFRADCVRVKSSESIRQSIQELEDTANIAALQTKDLFLAERAAWLVSLIDRFYSIYGVEDIKQTMDPLDRENRQISDADTLRRVNPIIEKKDRFMLQTTRQLLRIIATGIAEERGLTDANTIMREVAEEFGFKTQEEFLESLGNSPDTLINMKQLISQFIRRDSPNRFIAKAA